MDGKPLNSVESKRKRKRKISKEQIMVNQEQTKNKKQKIQQNVSGDKMQIPEGGTQITMKKPKKRNRSKSKKKTQMDQQQDLGTILGGAEKKEPTKKDLQKNQSPKKVESEKNKKKKKKIGQKQRKPKQVIDTSSETFKTNGLNDDKPKKNTPTNKNKYKNHTERTTDTQTNGQTPVEIIEPNLTSSSQQVPILHSSCSSKDNKEIILACWTSCCKKGHVFEERGIEVIKNPFTCCFVPNLLKNQDFLEGVKEELNNIQLIPKNNDLYKFHQTSDLKSITTPYISSLRDFLYTDLKQWLIDVTGIPLNDTVDMGSSRYSKTDVLLCHDDELEGRRIAYVLYLVPTWKVKDGGTLDLFSTDDYRHPDEVVRSLVPKNNALVFFKVSPISFHQVSEVLVDKTRLSINGWFHGPPIARPQRELPPPTTPLLGPGYLALDYFYSWINPIYIDVETQKEIRQKFCSESALELDNFLTDEAYERLSKAFKGESLAWGCTGPADRQWYEVLDPESLSDDLQECRKFLTCEAFFLVLSQLTGLTLHPYAPQDSEDEEEEEKPSAEPNPRCRVEAQRWNHGSYTLVRDDCVDQLSALDAYLFTNVSEKWSQDMGGYISYLSKDEDEELLTVLPRSRCLSLVYRDPKTIRFTKYINSATHDLSTEGSHYHSFSCVYYE